MSENCVVVPAWAENYLIFALRTLGIKRPNINGQTDPRPDVLALTPRVKLLALMPFMRVTICVVPEISVDESKGGI